MSENNKSGQNRREFLKNGALIGAVAGGSLGAFYFGYSVAHGNPLRVGVLGTGDEGSVLLGAVNPEYVQVCAIADLRPYNQYRAFHGDISSPAAYAARPGLMQKYGWKSEAEARKHVSVYQTWEGLLKDAKKLGLEGIIIALPLHLHAPAAICAMRNGLHVLTEKLMGHSITNCKEMAIVAKQTGKHLATGHQRHYNILYHEATQAIRNGVYGDVHFIRGQWHRNNRPGGDSWQMPLPYAMKPEDLQSMRLLRELRDLEQQLYDANGPGIEKAAKQVAQKKAQLADMELTNESTEAMKSYGYEGQRLKDARGHTYNLTAPEELLRWRLWARTGGGLMAELGSHQLDAASIFVAAAHGQELAPDKKPKHILPLSVSCNRAMLTFPGKERVKNDYGEMVTELEPLGRNAHDHVLCTLDFPAFGYHREEVMEEVRKSITKKAKPSEFEDEELLAEKKKIIYQYSTINGNGFGGYGEIVYGTQGTLILEKEQKMTPLLDEKPSAVKVNKSAALDTQASGPAQKAVKSDDRVVSRGYTEEIEHWAYCIRANPDVNEEGPQPRCNPQVALDDAAVALVANYCAANKTRVAFNEAWVDIEDEKNNGPGRTEEVNLKRENYSLTSSSTKNS